MRLGYLAHELQAFGQAKLRRTGIFGVAAWAVALRLLVAILHIRHPAIRIRRKREGDRRHRERERNQQSEYGANWIQIPRDLQC